MIGRVYSPEQHEAIAAAYETRTGPQVAALAREGALRHPNGELLPAFDIGADTVRSTANRLRKQMPAGDLAMANRRIGAALLKTAWQEVRALERQPVGKRDLKRLAQALTLHGRIQALHDRTLALEEPKPKPKPSGETIGPLLIAMRETGVPPG